MKSFLLQRFLGRWSSVLVMLAGAQTDGWSADDASGLDPAAIVRAETDRQSGLMLSSERSRQRAMELLRLRRTDEALALTNESLRVLPLNPTTAPLVSALQALREDAVVRKAGQELDRGDLSAARSTLTALAPEALRSGRALVVRRRLEAAELDPPPPPLAQASPAFVAQRREIAEIVARARAQAAGGDLGGARESYLQVLAIDPASVVAATELTQLAARSNRADELNRTRSREEMLSEVAGAWQRPAVLDETGPASAAGPSVDAPLAQKLAAIQVPSVSFNGIELSRVVAALSELSESLDATAAPGRGVNIVLLDPGARNPSVNLTLRNLSLKRVLDFITDAVGYQYEIQADAVVVRPGGETSALDTEVFPVSRSTVIRMTGPGTSNASSLPGPAATGGIDPFALLPASPAGGPPPAPEAQALRGFLQQAGVNFDGVSGSSLAYDGSAMIVTQTTRNLERIRNILNRYNDVRQVEIEAKFLEVQAGALEELGVTWNVARRGPPLLDPETGGPLLDATGAPVYSTVENYRTTGLRSLAEATRPTGNGSSILIDGKAVASTAAPSFPGSVLLGAVAPAVADVRSVIADFDVNALVRALSQKEGTDLLSAPKVTVLSGNPANIVVAQELRYPQSFGEIQSQVGSSNSAGTSGSAGVTVTAGTPRDFATRNVGVELRVTPTVEEDDYSISLDLNPKVTEFEGFVEYGGPSLAISSGKTVTIPPGFYQPIFSVREVATKVTLWDGATLVMGGLTREEVRTVDDRVPILGSVPLLGRLFRSKAESSQKRNLLIFVTANLVSPGGSLKKQSAGSIAPSTRFQASTVVTPGGPETRR